MKLLNLSFKKNEYKIIYIYIYIYFNVKLLFSKDELNGRLFFSFIQVSVRVHSFTNIFGKTGLGLQEALQWTRGPAHPCLFAGKCFYQIPINFPQLVFFYFHSIQPQKKEEETSSTSSSFSVTARPNSSGSDLSRSHSLWFLKLGFRLFSGQTEERNWKGTWGPPFFFLVACFLRKWESLFSQ